MKIKIFQHKKLKIKYDDDLLKVITFFKSKGIVIEFTQPTETDIYIKDCPVNLYLPNDNGEQDILMYIFDRRQRSSSYALNFSKTLQVIEVSTSIEDDTIDYTWKLICHELVHCLFHKLRNINIFLQDPMDSMLVNGIWKPYYKNEEPYALNGNFEAAFKILKPYMALFAQNGDLNPVTSYIEITRTFSDSNQNTGILEAYNNSAKFTCKTLELAWKNNLPNVSCIPKGTYKVRWTFSPRFLRYTYEIQGVPGRSGIRIHPANYFYQLNGCIALGNNLVDINGDGKLDTVNSKITVTAFEQFMNKKEFTLKIV